MDVLIDGDTEVAYEYHIGYGTKQIPATPDNPIRMAQEMGQKVLKEMKRHPGQRGVIIAGDGGVKAGDTLWIPVENLPTEPEPLKGLEWLKSLPVGTRIRGLDQWQCVVMVDGLHWTNGVVWKWQSIRVAWYADKACPENCPTWEPEDTK